LNSGDGWVAKKHIALVFIEILIKKSLGIGTQRKQYK